MKTLEVVISPALLPFYNVKNKTVVVIDILRATTSMCVAFNIGVEKILPLASIEECRLFKEFDFIIAAEKDALKVDGFDLGNSPFEFENPLLAGKNIALATTNGTKAIKYASENGASDIVIGSFLNIDVICNWLLTNNNDVILLCAGWKNKFNLEDTLFAGAVVNKIGLEFDIDCDSALSAKLLFVNNINTLENLVRESSHAKRFKLLSFQTDDVNYCLQMNTTPVLPILEGNYFKNKL
ncbi:MAG: 2-phosphosulfolactate phosphatase [Bacteroidia bacterium]|nr:2-phosphosulfolactate phosphatase [Bacteroidia bacterium]